MRFVLFTDVLFNVVTLVFEPWNNERCAQSFDQMVHEYCNCVNNASSHPGRATISFVACPYTIIICLLDWGRSLLRISILLLLAPVFHPTSAAWGPAGSICFAHLYVFPPLRSVFIPLLAGDTCSLPLSEEADPVGP